MMTSPPAPTYPTLSLGHHLSPADGTCLMEAVSRAARLPWSDAPECTHPLLGLLARLVNDASSEAGRQRLAALVPQLVAAGPGDADRESLVSAQIAELCTRMAMEIRPTLLLTHLHRTARAACRRETHPQPTHASGAARDVQRRLFSAGPGARAIETAVVTSLRLPAVQRDARLLDMLRRCLAIAVLDGPPTESERVARGASSRSGGPLSRAELGVVRVSEPAGTTPVTRCSDPSSEPGRRPW
jgi:hypothetical protein